MQTKEDALKIIDRLIVKAGHIQHFSYVAIKAKTIADILQEESGDPHHAMPTVCHALRQRFSEGHDYFRRGKDRDEWLPRIPDNAGETSTFEVLFEVNR